MIRDPLPLKGGSSKAPTTKFCFRTRRLSHGSGEMTARTTFRNRGAEKNLFLLVCAGVMFCCLLLEGAFLLFATLGWGFGGPPLISSIYIVWLVLFLATLAFFRWPGGALVVSWVFLLLVVSSEWYYRKDSLGEAPPSFYGVPLAYVVASHLGYFFALRKPTAKSVAPPP